MNVKKSSFNEKIITKVCRMGRPMKVSERVIGDAALLSHQWSIGCECNMPLDRSQW